MRPDEAEGGHGTQTRGGNGVDMALGARYAVEVEGAARVHHVAHPKPRSLPSRDGAAWCSQAALGS